ncbi:phosphatidate cytidylyltransferase [Frondihabitans sp. PhB188]|uniref:phosphatidate cytidylyltransferase n=1 Tax=Frondihabitans sp. PhB188 TaxID=2485200 RepID=UPI000F46A570|nr:phosphatidate cytidylyltransferase [Frondihabitans sp. PhB188]ROQ41398.1 phosphatidate cytidylyltransferase [Frondihabitans sp. PhB188]
MGTVPDDPERGTTPTRPDVDARAHSARHEIEDQLRAQRARLEASNAKLTERTGRNLPAAIGIGVGLGGSVLVSLILVKALFMVVAAVLILFMVIELTNAVRVAGRNVPRVPSVLTALAVVPAAYYWRAEGQWLVLLGGILFISLWRVAEIAVPSRKATGADLVRDLGTGAFVQIYTTFLGSFLVLLTAQDGGQWWALGTLIIVISVDTGAYAAGLNFGKHKMAPRISPKKTWEGFAGSAAAAMIAGVLIALFMIHEAWWLGVLMGAVLTLTATVGDLTESLIKRDLGIKDISTWLPGHGGFLDRLDSTLPSAVVAYALYLIFA